MNDLDIHPRSSQLLLLNGRMAYHCMLVDGCFNVYIQDRFQDTANFEVSVTVCSIIRCAFVVTTTSALYVQHIHNKSNKWSLSINALANITVRVRDTLKCGGAVSPARRG